jgi:hypothetical protein
VNVSSSTPRRIGSPLFLGMLCTVAFAAIGIAIDLEAFSWLWLYPGAVIGVLVLVILESAGAQGAWAEALWEICVFAASIAAWLLLFTLPWWCWQRGSRRAA